MPGRRAPDDGVSEGGGGVIASITVSDDGRADRAGVDSGFA